jgi:hypothetical protein
MKACKLSKGIEVFSMSQYFTTLNMIASKSGFVLIEEMLMLLSALGYITIYVHIGVGNNGLHLLKQAIGTCTIFENYLDSCFDYV